MDILSDIKHKDILQVSFGKATADMSKAGIRRVNDGFQLEYFSDNKAFHINFDGRDVFEHI